MIQDLSFEGFARRCFAEFRTAGGRDPVEPLFRAQDYYTLAHTKRPYDEKASALGRIMKDSVVQVKGADVPLSVHVFRVAAKNNPGAVEQAIAEGVTELEAARPTLFAPMDVPGGVFYAALLTAPLDDFCVRVVCAYSIEIDDLLYRFDVLGGVKA